VQAEAVLAVVDARTPGELSAALDRMAGGAGGDLREARATLLDLLADIEAEIDFADEATPDAVPRADAAVWLAMDRRLAEATAGVHDAATRLRLRDAGAAELPRVVLAGRPNIGKSSLFNALVGRDAALVADESGTTRDWIEAPLPAADDVSAPPICVVVDLAGLPAAAGVGIAQDHPDSDAAAVESAAVAAARREIARADLIVICRDAADSDDRDVVDHACSVSLDVRTRCDRVPQPVGPEGTAAIATSTVTGCGVEELAQAIRAAVAGLPPRSSPATLRMAAGLSAAAGPLAAASEAVGLAAAGGPIDEAVVAGQVRRAVEALGVGGYGRGLGGGAIWGLGGAALRGERAADSKLQIRGLSGRAGILCGAALARGGRRTHGCASRRLR
jgi:tRNA modification GTPase